MDATAIGFLILMSIAGGAVAWVADVWGYKIGKKKLSLWHIRPRHIARIFVVFAGILIPLIFFLIYFAVSAQFRQWVTEGQQAIRDAQVKSQQLEKVTREVSDAQNLLKVTSSEKDQIDRERERINKEVVKQKEQQKLLTNKLNSLGSTISKLQGTINTLQRQDAQLQTDKKNNEAKIVEVRNMLKTSQETLDDKKAQYQEAKKRLDETQVQSLRLTNQNSALDTKNKELQTQIAEFQKQLPELTATIADLKTSKTTAETEVKIEQDKIKEIQEKLAAVSIGAKLNLDEYKAFAKLTPTTFLKGEELGRITLEPKMSEADRHTAYRNLTRKARSIAVSRGSESENDNPFTGPTGMIIVDPEGRALNEDQVEQFWVQKFGTYKQEQVAVLSAASNCFGKESVLLQMEVHPNPLVFRKGEIVSETQYQPKATDSEIRASLREFLRTFVNTKARSRKMIPIKTRDGESFGELGEDQYFNAFLRARVISRTVRLVAVAQDDIRAGDPLNIDLEFR